MNERNVRNWRAVLFWYYHGKLDWESSCPKHWIFAFVARSIQSCFVTRIYLSAFLLHRWYLKEPRATYFLPLQCFELILIDLLLYKKLCLLNCWLYSQYYRKFSISSVKLEMFINAYTTKFFYLFPFPPAASFALLVDSNQNITVSNVLKRSMNSIRSAYTVIENES